jgi:hypothetical protein
MKAEIDSDVGKLGVEVAGPDAADDRVPGFLAAEYGNEKGTEPQRSSVPRKYQSVETMAQ